MLINSPNSALSTVQLALLLSPLYYNQCLASSLLFLPSIRCSFIFQGSHNIVFLCLEEKSKLVNGGFYRDGKIEVKENAKLDTMEDVGDKLWDLSEKLSGLK